ncbi:hypothetical protein ACTA71_007108 [Dictyostelium dimigraforme]
MINRLFSINNIKNGSKFFSTTTTKQPLVLLEKHLVGGKYTGIQIIKLNNPSHLNALTFEMGVDYKKVVDTLADDKDLKCVILTGEGKAFSSGGDLNFLIERTKDTPENNQRIMEKFYRTFLYIRSLPVPIISAINGAAIGAGFCLALATDIRICSNKARVGLAFTKLGIHPGMGVTHSITNVVNQDVASYMLLTSDSIQGDQAQKLGLVLKSVEPNELLPTALEMAETISNNSSIAVKSTLKTLRNKYNSDLDRSLTREADAQSQCWASKDIIEGILAIKESRNPKHNKLIYDDDYHQK